MNLKYPYVFFSPDEGGGGGEIPPAPEPEPEPAPQPEPEPQPDIDAELTKAQADYRARMEAIGGKFDSAGNFLGFDVVAPQQPQTTTQDDEYPDIDSKLAKLENRIVSQMAPDRVSGLLSSVVESNPTLGRYRKQAEAILKTSDPRLLSKEYVESILYFARGQAADVEIAEAKKSERERLSKDQQRIAAGAAAGSEPAGGGKPQTGGNAKITDEVREYATAWGLDPQEVANQMAARGKK